jgi:hypothetical protein
LQSVAGDALLPADPVHGADRAMLAFAGIAEPGPALAIGAVELEDRVDPGDGVTRYVLGEPLLF